LQDMGGHGGEAFPPIIGLSVSTAIFER
jgi:hypothetical protein